MEDSVSSIAQGKGRPVHRGGLRARALLWLLLCLAVLVLGPLVQVEEGRARLLGYSGPPCLVGRVLGEKACPGCGLTRAAALTLQGRPREALAFHPAGPLLVLFCLCGAALNLAVLLRGRTTPFQRRLLRLGRILFPLIILTAWLVRLLL